MCDNLVMMFYLSLLTARPPSKAALRRVFENTRNLSYLCTFLSIPRDKRDVDSAVEYYIQSTRPRKMREMIWELDWIGDTGLADSLMEYAEPPAGMATVENTTTQPVNYVTSACSSCCKLCEMLKCRQIIKICCII